MIERWQSQSEGAPSVSFNTSHQSREKFIVLVGAYWVHTQNCKLSVKHVFSSEGRCGQLLAAEEQWLYVPRLGVWAAQIKP